jgi:hypothetical protein
VLKKIGHEVRRAAVAVAKAAYKYSGAQDVVSCVTHPSLAGCAKAALTVALTVGTAGEGEVAEIGLNAAEHAAETAGEDTVKVFCVHGPEETADIAKSGPSGIRPAWRVSTSSPRWNRRRISGGCIPRLESVVLTASRLVRSLAVSWSRLNLCMPLESDRGTSSAMNYCRTSSISSIMGP